METGNTLLKQIYNILKRSIRKEEIVTRSECDHYFMLLEGDREERVRERLEQMLEEVSGAPELRAVGMDLETALGACMITDHRLNIRILQDRAVRASEYCESQSGCVFYNEALEARNLREKRLGIPLPMVWSMMNLRYIFSQRYIFRRRASARLRRWPDGIIPSMAWCTRQNSFRFWREMEKYAVWICICLKECAGYSADGIRPACQNFVYLSICPERI